jgi:hypothetical protein
VVQLCVHHTEDVSGGKYVVDVSPKSVKKEKDGERESPNKKAETKPIR